MNTLSTFQKIPYLLMAAFASMVLMLAGCGEQTGEQQSSAPAEQTGTATQ